MDDVRLDTKTAFQEIQEDQYLDLDILVARELLQVQRIHTIQELNDSKTVSTDKTDDSPANSPKPKVQVPDHRDVVAKWMNEAVLFALELSSPEDILSSKPPLGPRLFTLAASLMDMFLMKCKIKLTQLQLLGSACLSLAAKSRKIHLSDNALIECSDYTITSEEIQVCTFDTERENVYNIFNV